MNSCIAYDSSPPVLENTARPSDFLTSTKHSHAQSRCICHVEKTSGLRNDLKYLTDATEVTCDNLNDPSQRFRKGQIVLLLVLCRIYLNGPTTGVRTSLLVFILDSMSQEGNNSNNSKSFRSTGYLQSTKKKVQSRPAVFSHKFLWPFFCNSSCKSKRDDGPSSTGSLSILCHSYGAPRAHI